MRSAADRPLRSEVPAGLGLRGQPLAAEPRGGDRGAFTGPGPYLVLNASIASPGAGDRSAKARAEVLAAEIKSGSCQGPERAQLLRLLRWQRQSAARVLLQNQKPWRGRKPYKVSKCYRVNRKPSVEVNYSARVKRAHYAGLVTCASVWVCPVCSAKITERRRAEIQAAETRGLSAFMVTFTLQHAREDKLRDVRDHLAAAYRRLKAGKGWMLFAERWQIVGSVAGVEVTYGLANGWHPHRHVLMWSRLAASAIDAAQIQAELSRKFGAILEKRGRYAHPIHGVDVRAAGDLIAEYIAKFGHEPKDQSWSLAAEITKGGAKSVLCQDQHYTPFQLLDLFLAGDRSAGALFREYASAMFRSNQLVWSRGTRELLGLVAVAATDEELAAAQEQDAELFALLSAEDWRGVLRLGLRGHLLEVASRHERGEFEAWIHASGIHNGDPSQ